MGFKLTFLSSTVLGSCPGIPCDFISDYSSLLLGILILKGFIFLLSLFPFIVSWKGKVDGKSRIFFAFFACVSFYVWLILLIVNSTLCFGFLSHKGPCAEKLAYNETRSPSLFLNPEHSDSFALSNPVITSTPSPITLLITKPTTTTRSSKRMATTTTSTITTTTRQSSPPAVKTTQVPILPVTVDSKNNDNKRNNLLDEEKISPRDNLSDPGAPVMAPLSANLFVRNISCTSHIPSNQNTAQLKRVTLLNVLILIFLVIVLLANAREALTAKALYHKETLCNKDEVQKFLSSLVSKKPEVGHLVNCFHTAKTSSGKSLRKVITFSAIENFFFDSWRDFSDVRLIDPSAQYPVIEIDILLNFFPGDHFTAEKYKSFVTSLTKTHSSKDSKITIDDYFHIEDQREWTFFIGNPEFIVPWWDRMPLKGIVSCGLLLGWPFRARYGGRMAKHRIEIKKAVFCVEATAPPSESEEAKAISEDQNETTGPEKSPPPGGECKEELSSSGKGHKSPEKSPVILEDTGHRASPPQYTPANKIPSGGVSVFPPVTSSSVHSNCLRGPTPNRSMPISSPRTHLRETTKDIVTAVTHHDINGVNSTVALKDIDVKMSSISGYETYV